MERLRTEGCHLALSSALLRPSDGESLAQQNCCCLRGNAPCLPKLPCGEVSAPGENKYVINLRKRAVNFGSNKVLRQLRREARSLHLPPHTLELFNKGRDLLKYRLLLGQELRVQWAHLGQNSIELCAVLAGKFPLE